MLNMEPPSPKKDKSDSYGSVLREGMKKSMEEPYRALNKREPRNIEAWILGAFILGVLSFGIGIVYIFNYLEGLAR